MKPCPRCKCTNIELYEGISENYVVCEDCGMRNGDFETIAAAIEDWNTRHEPKVVAEFEAKSAYKEHVWFRYGIKEDINKAYVVTITKKE